MNFYKSIDISNGIEIFINPKLIENILIMVQLLGFVFSSGLWSEIDKSDFKHMIILEGAYEY